jgi:hypothetical protein
MQLPASNRDVPQNLISSVVEVNTTRVDSMADDALPTRIEILAYEHSGASAAGPEEHLQGHRPTTPTSWR